MFKKVLIANRGEIAIRVARTCKELDIAPVAVYSDADEKARHVAAASEAVHLPGVDAKSTYLDADAIIRAAGATGADAIHPGYGFLSESSGFARAVIDAGLAWIGPPPDAIAAAGDKVQARLLASRRGVPIVPGTTQAVADLEAVRSLGRAHGYPLAVKASGGGGGRGFRIARSESELDDALASARREAGAFFGSEDVYIERYLDAPKHLEVQVLAPERGDILWLGVRDCSLQRRHQKLVEETPPARFNELAEPLGAAAVAVAEACGYSNAGTVEFLVDGEGSFYFIEMNARLQVEHTVTEEVFGLDLVACQLLIAAGEPLGFTQEDLEPRGHSIQCRINAEDPQAGWAPSPGLITRFVHPGGPGVRLDAGYIAGDEVPAAYDSLIAKLVTWGADRGVALKRMLRALDETVIEGIATTIPAHRELLQLESFLEGNHSTRTVEDEAVFTSIRRAGPEPPTTQAGLVSVGGGRARLWSPAMAAAAPAAMTESPNGARSSSSSVGAEVAPMQATIVQVLVEEGRDVDLGDPLVVLETMKMETHVTASSRGTVTEVLVKPGETARAGQPLVVIG
jgi:acetyl-CoA/propionyl-CoA/long-chain acyl-CoA carboxylase, biotin carboxylase, biotin carboxyl carrier protein